MTSMFAIFRAAYENSEVGNGLWRVRRVKAMSRRRKLILISEICGWLEMALSDAIDLIESTEDWQTEFHRCHMLLQNKWKARRIRRIEIIIMRAQLLKTSVCEDIHPQKQTWRPKKSAMQNPVSSRWLVERLGWGESRHAPRPIGAENAVGTLEENASDHFRIDRRAQRPATTPAPAMTDYLLVLRSSDYFLISHEKCSLWAWIRPIGTWKIKRRHHFIAFVYDIHWSTHLRFPESKSPFFDGQLVLYLPVRHLDISLLHTNKGSRKHL